jgi:hypothetical protein
MATITATKAGNWSDTTVWDLSRVPAAGDDVALGGYVIVWDSGARIPATSGTLTSISSTGSAGQISLDLSSAFCDSGCSLYVTTFTGGTGPATTGTLLVTGTTSNVLTLTTTDITTSSNSYAVNHTGTGTINVYGNMTSVTGSLGCLRLTGTGTIHYYGPGTIQAGGGHGIAVFAAGTVIIDGSTGDVNVIGSNTGAQTVFGIVITSGAGAATLTFSGPVNVTGGSAATLTTGDSTAGIGNLSTTSTWTASGETIFSFSGFSPPWVGYAPAWQPTTGYIKMYTGASTGQAANTEFPQVLPAKDIREGVTSGSVTGTLSYPTLITKILTESGWTKGI